MKNTERFRAVLNFESTDRLPVIEWASWWNDTVKRWYGEGLSQEIPWDRIQTHFGLDYIQRIWMPLVTPDCPRPKSHGAPLIESEEEYDDFKKFLYPDETQINYARKIDVLRRLKDEQARGYYKRLLEQPKPSFEDYLNAAHVEWVSSNKSNAIELYNKAKDCGKSVDEITEHIMHDKETLLARGISEKELLLLRDMLY